ncbi:MULTISPECIES: hypothetical protein [Paenibacillus]|uniref:hypothetical protein n=1 Tax=Paenibacillus TaxID=44249 RepID=UPI0015E3DD56|nr:MULTISPECIES: hypothetical protein [Paenibacillus]MBJ9987135.1 hypothetical protein [Paenibacillus sp. S28]MEC0173711.1 hypothetical protein [Paenibacillus favisporus]
MKIEVQYNSPLGAYLINIGSVVIGIIVLLTWSLRKKNRVDWNRIEPEDAKQVS